MARSDRPGSGESQVVVKSPVHQLCQAEAYRNHDASGNLEHGNMEWQV